MPRPDVSEERTTQIIDAAIKVFSDQGISNARMDDIAEEVGVSKGTLYLYFKSKDAIISAILEALLKRELAHARDLIAAEIPPETKLHQLADIMITDLTKIKPLVPLYFEFMAMVMRRNAVHEVLTTSFNNFIEVMQEIIQQGIDVGAFRPINTLDAALAIGAVFEGTILLWTYSPKQVDISRHVGTGLDLLLDGLKA